MRLRLVALLVAAPAAGALRLAARGHARTDTIRMAVPPPLPVPALAPLVRAAPTAAVAVGEEPAAVLFPGVSGLPSSQLLAGGVFGGGAPAPPSPPTAAGQALDLIERGLGTVGAKTAEFVQDERTQAAAKKAAGVAVQAGTTAASWAFVAGSRAIQAAADAAVTAYTSDTTQASLALVREQAAGLPDAARQKDAGGYVRSVAKEDAGRLSDFVQAAAKEQGAALAAAAAQKEDQLAAAAAAAAADARDAAVAAAEQQAAALSATAQQQATALSRAASVEAEELKSVAAREVDAAAKKAGAAASAQFGTTLERAPSDVRRAAEGVGAAAKVRVPSYFKLLKVSTMQ